MTSTMSKMDDYQAELRNMVESRTGVPCEPWLYPQIRAAAANMVLMDKMLDELLDLDGLVCEMEGSNKQPKKELNPLLPVWDKAQRTLMMQLECLGLNYKATPSKVKEDTRKGVSENDGLINILKGTIEDVS